MRILELAGLGAALWAACSVVLGVGFGRLIARGAEAVEAELALVAEPVVPPAA
jgi:hypothetical protein